MESQSAPEPELSQEPDAVTATVEAAETDPEADHDGLFVAFLVGLLLLLTLCVALTVVAANRAPG